MGSQEFLIKGRNWTALPFVQCSYCT